MKHGILHILGCLIPISLIFILPALGFGSGVTFTVFFILMFACHLLMMGDHSQSHQGFSDEDNGQNNLKEGK